MPRRPSAAMSRRSRRFASFNKLFLLFTHVVDTVQAAADRVIMLAHGRVVADVQTASLGVGELERLFLERLEQSREAGRR